METGSRNQLGSREKQYRETVTCSFYTSWNTVGPLDDSSDGRGQIPTKAHVGTYFERLVCISGDRVDVRSIWSWTFFFAILNKENYSGSCYKGPSKVGGSMHLAEIGCTWCHGVYWAGRQNEELFLWHCWDRGSFRPKGKRQIPGQTWSCSSLHSQPFPSLLLGGLPPPDFSQHPVSLLLLPAPTGPALWATCAPSANSFLHQNLSVLCLSPSRSCGLKGTFQKQIRVMV